MDMTIEVFHIVSYYFYLFDMRCMYCALIALS